MAGVGQGTSNVTGETNSDPDFPRRIFFQASFPVRWGAGPSHAPCVGNTIVLFRTMAKVTRLNRSPPESIASH